MASSDDDDALLHTIVGKHKPQGRVNYYPPPNSHTHARTQNAGSAHHDHHGSEYPHENDHSEGVFGSAYDTITGKPAHIHPQFRISGVEVSVANASLFAHHELALEDVMTWQYLFTMCMLGMSVVVGVLASFVVSGIVTSYNNGVMFLVTAIGVAVLVVLQFGALLRDWTRYTPFSHLHNNTVLLPAMYFLIANTVALVALGYWATKFPADFFSSYDPAAAPPAERPYYYGVYALLSVMCISTVPDLIASLTVQRYPERKLNLYRESQQSLLYYVTDNPSEGVEVNLRQ